MIRKLVAATIAVFVFGFAQAQAADDIFITVYNASSKKVTISNIQCSSIACSTYPIDIAAGTSEMFSANHNSSGYGWISLDVGVSSNKCRLNTWSLYATSGTITSLDTSPFLHQLQGVSTVCSGGSAFLSGSDAYYNFTIAGF